MKGRWSEIKGDDCGVFFRFEFLFFLVAEVLNCRTLWKFEWSVDLGFGSGCIGGAKGGVGGHKVARDESMRWSEWSV